MLTTMGNRRSKGIQWVAKVLALATFLAPLRMAWADGAAPPVSRPGALPQDQPRRSSERVRPIAIEDLGGRLTPATLWRLFDGNAETGLDSSQPVKIRLSFSAPTTVDAVGAYGGAGGTLVLRGVDGAGDAGRPGNLGAGSQQWTRVAAKEPRSGTTFVVEWSPTKAAKELAELEIWGRGSDGDSLSSDPAALTDAIFAGDPSGGEAFTSMRREQRISAATPVADRTFSVSLPFATQSIERAFLTYELDGLPHFTAARRSINGGPMIGGFGVSLGAQGGLQVEEISVAALRTGRNDLRFDPSPESDPVGYRVSGLKLVVTHSSPARARGESADVEDGKETTGWDGKAASARRWRFAKRSHPHELEFRLTRKTAGQLVVRDESAGDSHQIQIDLTDLAAGWHQVNLDQLPSTDALTLALAGVKEQSPFISEVRITGSALPAAGSAMRVVYPLHGECVNHQVHVRGLLPVSASELRANGSRVNPEIGEPGAFNFTAAEKALGGKPGKPFSVRLEAIEPSGAVDRTEIPIAGCVDRLPVVASRAGVSARPKEDVGAPYGMVVRPDRDATLEFGGAKLEIPAGAVDADVRVTVRPLSPGQVPVLGAGMVNVTAGGRAFRLGPREMQFKKPVTLTLPIDRARIEASDVVRTFYFDEKAQDWLEVPTGGNSDTIVVAETTHFTDFIAATLAVPEHPGLQSMNPTSLKDLKLGNPTAGIEMLAPPQPNSQGTAGTSYPIEVPPGRLGMQPHLAIAYDNTAGNGWLGVGWNLRTSAIEIDTRYGVPRYDGTEQYTIDGESLTPASAAPSGAPAGTYFIRRNEGRFDWIQRVLQTNGGYYWLVTDKAGIRYTYGQADTSRLVPLNVSSALDYPRTFRWLLEKVEDMNGNQVLYNYTVDRGNNGDPYVEVYPSEIDYTARGGSKTSATYSVVFNLQSANRTDAFSTGRPGFQELTQKLLASVDVKNGANIVRKYVLTYLAGDFAKNLLQTIEIKGQGGTGTGISKETFTYFQTPKDSSNNPKVFATPAQYSSLLDGSSNPLSGNSLADTYATNSSWNVSLGIASAGSTDIEGESVRSVTDIDGDGLPDLLPMSQTDGNKQTLTISSAGVATGPMSVATFNGCFGNEYGKEVTHYLNSSYDYGIVSGGEDYGNISEQHATLQDVNGDGILDTLIGADDDQLYVALGKGLGQGFETGKQWTGYKRTGLNFSCGDVFSAQAGFAANALTASPPSFPSVDIITRWVAPYAGTVQITGVARKLEAGGDGLFAQLYESTQMSPNFLQWQRTFAANDTADCTPAPGPGAPWSNCGPASGSLTLIARPGDRVYTRVNAIGNTDHDILSWNTTMSYQETPAVEALTLDATGTPRYTWTEARDTRVSGAFYTPWKAVANGTVDLTVHLQKDPTSDVVNVVAQKLSNGVSSQLLNSPFGSDFASSDDIILSFPGLSVAAGDEIHVYVQSDLPIDPGRVRVLAEVDYTNFCRINPYTGTQYCGAPVCTPLDPSAGAAAGSACLIGTTDPFPTHPVPQALISQIAPTYYPFQDWALLPVNPVTLGTTTVDGRIKVLGGVPNPPLSLCLINDPAAPVTIGTPATLVLQSVTPQGVPHLIAKLPTSFVAPGTEIPPCLTIANATGVKGTDQVFFSVYFPATHPPFGSFHADARINGSLIPKAPEYYYINGNSPLKTTFPAVGQLQPMSGGYHDFSVGTWNGNQPFDEAQITSPTGGSSYQALREGPVPVVPPANGVQAFSFSLGGILSSVYHFVSGVAKYVYDKVTKAAKVVGSTYLAGIRVLGSIVGKIMAWAVCEVSGASYTASGIRYTENHSSQTGVGLVATVGTSSGVARTGLDLMDMNGDRIPDQVSTVGIRYGNFDPVNRIGSWGPDTPTVLIPDNKPRFVAQKMYTVGLGASAPRSDAQSTDSSAATSGVQVEAGISGRLSEGFSIMSRDLRDVNGDGLPDVVDVGSDGYSLSVRLNYGYGFSSPITWSSAAWSVTQPNAPNLFPGISGLMLKVSQSLQGANPTPGKAIRLEESGHRGGGIGVSGNGAGIGYGMDASYVRTLVDLVDINGDGLPDQVMKEPGKPFRVKFNLGSKFGTEVAVAADAWPAMPPFMFADPNTPVAVGSVDALDFSHNDSWDFNVNAIVAGVSIGDGTGKTTISLMDIDGDGRLDHVIKNADLDSGNASNAKVWARLNQVGKSNLLKTATHSLGGTFELDYARQGNIQGTFFTPAATGEDRHARHALERVAHYNDRRSRQPLQRHRRLHRPHRRGNSPGLWVLRPQRATILRFRARFSHARNRRHRWYLHGR